MIPCTIRYVVKDLEVVKNFWLRPLQFPGIVRITRAMTALNPGFAGVLPPAVTDEPGDLLV